LVQVVALQVQAAHLHYLEMLVWRLAVAVDKAVRLADQVVARRVVLVLLVHLMQVKVIVVELLVALRHIMHQQAVAVAALVRQVLHQQALQAVQVVTVRLHPSQARLLPTLVAVAVDWAQLVHFWAMAAQQVQAAAVRVAITLQARRVQLTSAVAVAAVGRII
jgi:hypothetical protein